VAFYRALPTPARPSCYNPFMRWTTPVRRLIPFAALSLALPTTGAGCDSASLVLPAIINAPRGVGIQRGITYSRTALRDLQLDLYRPIGVPGPLPMVVLVHGGSWRTGSRDGMRQFAYDVAAQGYVAASIDYRLIQDGGIFPAPVADVLKAIAFLRARASEYDGDPQRVGVLGVSAGAHLAMLAGMAGDTRVFDAEQESEGNAELRAVVNIEGPTDFTVNAALAQAWQIERVEAFLGRPLAEAGALRVTASPITYVRSDGPAVLIIHGDADDTVPVDQARRLAAALQTVGQKHDYREIPGMNHLAGGFWEGSFVQAYRPILFAFLAENL